MNHRFVLRIPLAAQDSSGYPLYCLTKAYGMNLDAHFSTETPPKSIICCNYLHSVSLEGEVRAFFAGLLAGRRENVIANGKVPLQEDNA